METLDEPTSRCSASNPGIWTGSGQVAGSASGARRDRLSGISHRAGACARELRLPLAVVDSIVGQTRMKIVFRGVANHAGTTPMRDRQDALACAAEWILEVEKEGRGNEGLVATVGQD